MNEVVTRVLWLNGPHYVGKRTLARHLRDQWGVAVLDGEVLGCSLQEGLPAGLDPGDLQDFGIWLWSLWRLGVEMARTYRLVVLAATVYRPATVTELLGRFREADIDILHVVLAASDRALKARIHANDVSPDARRWALEHMRPAVGGLGDVREGVRLDTTGRSPGQLTADLAHALVHHGWLTPDAAWTTRAPGAGPTS